MIELHYTSQRNEVWQWYWKTWRERLWKLHVPLFVILSVSFFVIAGGPSHPPSSIIVAIALTLGALAFMVVYPQLRFKPQRRFLVLNEDGLRTTIGKKSGSRSWREIKSVAELSGYVIITGKNGNAFIIPPRAFDSLATRESVLSFVKAALAKLGA